MYKNSLDDFLKYLTERERDTFEGALIIIIIIYEVLCISGYNHGLLKNTEEAIMVESSCLPYWLRFLYILSQFQWTNVSMVAATLPFPPTTNNKIKIITKRGYL